MRHDTQRWHGIFDEDRGVWKCDKTECLKCTCIFSKKNEHKGANEEIMCLFRTDLLTKVKAEL